MNERSQKVFNIMTIIAMAAVIGMIVVWFWSKPFVNKAIEYEKSAVTYYSNKMAISMEDPYIYINIPEYKLYFQDRVYNIGVGSIKTPSPIGVGYVFTKRDQVVFTYSQGILKGQKIIYYTDKKGIRHPMPYDKMRALGIFVNEMINYSIHSTTEDDSIGNYMSHGCFRIKINDMLDLYPRIDTGTVVVIDYNLHENKFKNIYNLNHQDPLVGFKIFTNQ